MPIRYIDLNSIIKKFKRVRELERQGWHFYEYDPIYKKLKFYKVIGKVRTTRGKIKEKHKHKFLTLTREESNFINLVSLCGAEKNPEKCVEQLMRMFYFIFEDVKSPIKREGCPIEMKEELELERRLREGELIE